MALSFFPQIWVFYPVLIKFSKNVLKKQDGSTIVVESSISVLNHTLVNENLIRSKEWHSYECNKHEAFIKLVDSFKWLNGETFVNWVLTNFLLDKKTHPPAAWTLVWIKPISPQMESF